jgi:hypothetical protein
MAPPSGLHQSSIASDFEAPFPPLVRSSTVPASLKSHRVDPSHLAPEDAYASFSPPRRTSTFDSAGNGSGTDSRPRRIRRNDASRSRSRRRKRFQKLLWVKQSCRPRTPSLPSLPSPLLFSRPLTRVFVQTPTTTRTRQRSSRTCSGTRGSSPTTFGPWLPTQLSLCSTSVQS